MESHINTLRAQMDRLLTLQEVALSQLDAITCTSWEDIERLLSRMCVAMESTTLEQTEQQAGSSFSAELKHFQTHGPFKSPAMCIDERLKGKHGAEKPNVCLEGLKSQKKCQLPDEADPPQAEKLHQQNTQLAQGNSEPTSELLAFFQHEEKLQERRKEELQAAEEKEERVKDADVLAASELVEGGTEWREINKHEEKEVTGKEEDSSLPDVLPLFLPPCKITGSCTCCQESSDGTVRQVIGENLQKDNLTSQVEGRPEEAEESEEEGKPELEEEEGRKEGKPMAEEYIIDCSLPPPAPFEHRVITPKTHRIAAYYTINREEVLGGGRFGMVHKCVERSSGLTLAAKIIKVRSQKEKEVVRSEIEVMNQLNHANLIQLYAAYESRYDITLIMEYVEGGELFDRIIDENYKLTELDTVLFIRQITEGLEYMHKMYILHLDLKPENILCVSRETNKIKIIDFGLARRYKPREKLRVNFGTPEFLAPEVINYEFVSFPTDMWSLGVITYMLLSGLSPFLGDDDNETLNNILACQWTFEGAEFSDISDEAKDFIQRLLVKSKSWRMSASQSLKHPWLSNPSLHYRLHQKKNKCHSRHAPPPES
ncbi:myosin light chain kinase family member 4 [Electrophorus electricus]|uniref:myosin light chain kinase family member 4 n=1 Tax=Electrophorus electricus TaxID=8005 RepID=UPI0015CFDB1F|nr:myosin light chain kinase family member 4 [Electrophorus electricus]